MTERVNTHCCYYNTVSAGSAWLRDTSGKPPTASNNDWYSDTEVDRVAISVATADEEDGEPPETFKFGMRVANVPGKSTDRTFDIDVNAYITKDELKRLHAVFGLLLGISAP